MNLNRKIILITGGASDIARSCATLFTELGARVILTDLKPVETDFDFLKLNLTDDNCVETLNQYLKEKDTDINVLINVAAIGGTTLENTTTDSFRKVFEVNTLAAFKLSLYLARKLIENQKEGSIVNIASIHGSVPNTDPSYSASKAALLALTRSMALKLAPHGIRVNAISPGAISGGMNSQLNREEVEKIKKEIPLAKFGSPDDIAHAIAFLISDQARYITGQDLRVDGGLSLTDSSFNK